jgi:hypothetical protein
LEVTGDRWLVIAMNDMAHLQAADS